MAYVQHRYFNLLVVRSNASPVTAQLWSDDRDEAARAARTIFDRYAEQDGARPLVMYVHDTRFETTVEVSR